MSVFNCLHLCSFSIKLGVTAIYVCILATLKNLHQKLKPHCLRGLRECFGEYPWKKVAIPQLYTAETRCSVYASSASLRRPNSIKGWGLRAVLIGLVEMFTSSPRQAGLLKGFISNQVRTSSLDSRHKVSYAQTEPGQRPLSLWHHSAQLFSSVGSSLSVLLAQRLWQQIPCSGTTASSAGSDFQLHWQGPWSKLYWWPSAEPSPWAQPNAALRFYCSHNTARLCAQPAHFCLKTKSKACQKWSVLPALLQPAVVKGRRAIPISTAEEPQSSAAQPTFGSSAASWRNLSESIIHR